MEPCRPAAAAQAELPPNLEPLRAANRSRIRHAATPRPRPTEPSGPGLLPVREREENPAWNKRKAKVESAPYSRLLASSVRKDVPGFPPTDTPRQFSKAPAVGRGLVTRRGEGAEPGPKGLRDRPGGGGSLPGVVRLRLRRLRGCLGYRIAQAKRLGFESATVSTSRGLGLSFYPQAQFPHSEMERAPCGAKSL